VALPELLVRPAAAGDEDTICAVCSAGFSASSRGLVSEEEIARRIAEYYNPERVRSEVEPAPPYWSGYVVGELEGHVVGATGGSLDAEVGHVLVLYLDLDLRGSGIGTALLDHLTVQQRGAGAVRQRVSVTEGNEMGLPFYRARGFREVAREPFGPAPEEGRTAHSIVMERPL
jgi:GNAT superfamily N-acetyltransferase